MWDIPLSRTTSNSPSETPSANVQSSMKGPNQFMKLTPEEQQTLRARRLGISFFNHGLISLILIENVLFLFNQPKFEKSNTPVKAHETHRFQIKNFLFPAFLCST